MTMTAHPRVISPSEPVRMPEVAVKSPRLASLDVFRGLTIVMMLVVNNIGDSGATEYWFKHAGFIRGTQAQAYRDWFAGFGGLSGVGAWVDHVAHLPLLMHCTLADFVMPWFLLIIGLALPFATAASLRRAEPSGLRWFRIVKRSVMLVILGWIVFDLSLPIVRWLHNSDPEAPLQLTLGMNVLQLLGVSYLAARSLYSLPARPRLLAAGAMLVGHWAILRYFPQPITSGGGGTGSLTATANALTHIYNTWQIGGVRVWGRWPGDGLLGISLRGMLSVPPTAATMIIGAWAGEQMQCRELLPMQLVRRLMMAGVVLAVGGFAWAFDLPFNKPLWTPSYLLYTSGVGLIVMAGLYWLIDICNSRWWTAPLAAFGANAIGVYFLSLMFKIWVLGLIRLPNDAGKPVTLTRHIVALLQAHLGPAGGSWAFTIAYIALLWMMAYVAYRKVWIWKV